MSATISPGTPRAARSTGTAPAPRAYRLGQELGDAAGQWAVVWKLKRNCSLAPRQLFGCYSALCMLSLAVAMFFWWLGARMVLSFAGLELLTVGALLLVHARHITDNESIALCGDRLLVEHVSGSRMERMEFQPQWVRVEPAAVDGSLIELSGQGRRIAVGRYLRPEQRRQLADELRMALRHSSLHGRNAAQ